MTIEVEQLNRLSREKAINPVAELDFSRAPEKDRPWFSEALVSLYRHPVYQRLTPAQKTLLAQKEFALLCSVSCSGEKEVISNVARIMLKKRFAPVRSYLHHFIAEENNHIYMFSQFCDRFDQLYPVRYLYAQGDLWEDADLSDLMVFVHVMIFEELGDSFNRRLAEDEQLPALVRRINAIHFFEEARHISFGRKVVGEMAAEILPRLGESQRTQLREHLGRYLDTRHYDYHNYQIYREVGVPDALQAREETIASQDVGFFAKTGSLGRNKVVSLLDFLKTTGLISGHRMLSAAKED